LELATNNLYANIRPMNVDSGNKGNISADKWKRTFWIVLGITTVIRLIYALKVPLTGDEAYFWEWARHPALSYYDHPPLAGWILVITTAIFGSTVAGVRIAAVLAMSAVFIVIRKMTFEISGSAQTASLAGLLAMGIPLLEVSGILYSTDTPLILAGAVGGYFFYRAVEHGSDIAWWGLGISMGAAVMSKFLGAALPASFAGYLLLSPAHRHYLRRPGPYVAVAVTGVSFLPALVWNAANGWATFVFNFSARLKTPGINLTNTLDYVIGQAVAMSPVVLFFAIPALYIFFPSRVKRENSFDIPAFFALVPLAGFLAVSLTNKVGAHWPGVGFPMLAVALSGYLLKNSRINPRFILTAVTAWATTVALLSLPFAIRFIPEEWNYPLRPEKFNASQLKKIAFSPEETGKEIALFFEELKTQGPAFLFTKSYALSSLIAFYTTGQPDVTVLGSGSVHGRNHLFWFDPEDHIGENALFVSYRSFEDEKTSLKERFERLEIVSDSAAVPDGASLTIVKAYGFNGKR